MSGLNLTVNGEKISSAAEPRTSLADLLREELCLTGTHLGCEQGVCGACTILVDGVPVRSCISNAAACSGATVRTIEDFDDDDVMAELRHAFNEHHALQCGFCTPGMLIMARDIVTRLGVVDEARVRTELAGNLCRCTGYSGIVKAIQEVAAARGSSGDPLVARLPLGPAGSGHSAAVAQRLQKDTNAFVNATTQVKTGAAGTSTAGKRAPGVSKSFSVAAPPSVVWERFGDVEAMVRCIPGASLISSDPDGTYKIRMRIKMGPIGAEFAGIARQERNQKTLTGIIHGSGRDAKSASLADGELSYSLFGEDDGASTRVDINISYLLSGALAQFARAGIVTHFVGAITAQFAENLSRSLMPGGAENTHENASELRLVGSLRAALRGWLRELMGRYFRN